MNKLYFDIYNYQIEIVSSEFALRHLKINTDFSFFAVSKNSATNLQVSLTELRPLVKEGIRIGTTRMCEVRQVGLRKRQLIYRKSGRTLAVVSDTTSSVVRKVEIQALNTEIIDDILYFLINACAGEFLDTHGIMRVHAFSFFGECGGIVYGPSGSGKSTLALSFLNHSTVKIYSDEISLFSIRQKKLFPYPIRISADATLATASGIAKFNVYFGKKTLFVIPDGRVGPITPAKLLFILKPNARVTAAATRKDKLKFAFEIIFGLGLIQMWEYLLRLDNIAVLFKIFLQRLKLAFYLLELGPICIASRRPIDEITATIEQRHSLELTRQ